MKASCKKPMSKGNSEPMNRVPAKAAPAGKTLMPAARHAMPKGKKKG